MYTKPQIDALLSCDMLSKNKAGNYIARWGYFYRHGKRSADYAERVMRAIPSATIIDKGDHFTSFKGGKGIKANSHFYVEFTIPPYDTTGVQI